MLEIKPIQSKEIQRELAGRCNVDYVPEAFAYSAYEGDRFLGMSQFTIEDGYALIINISHASDSDDEEAMFIMGRAVLNFLDLCEVTVCRINSNAASRNLILKIGFRSETEKSDGTPSYHPLTLTGMFDAKCHPHNK